MLKDKIKLLRLKTGYTQKQLAEKLHLSQQAVAKWEKGTSEPDSEMLLALSHMFQVSTDYLLGETSFPTSYSSPVSGYPLHVWLSASKKKAIYDCFASVLSARSLTEQEAIAFAGAIENFFPSLHSNSSDICAHSAPVPLIDILKVAEYLSVLDEIAAILREPDEDPYPPENKRILLDISSAFYRHRIAYKKAPPLIQNAVRATLDALLTPYDPSAASTKEDAVLDKSGEDPRAAPSAIDVELGEASK